MGFEGRPRPKIETKPIKPEQPKPGPGLEQPLEQKSQETAKQATDREEKEAFSIDYTDFKSVIERQIGKQLPEKPEDFIDQFDKLVPKDLPDTTFAGTKQLRRFRREDIRNYLERKYWGGASLEDVDSYFAKKQDEANDRLEKYPGDKELYQEYQEWGRLGVEMQDRNYGKLLSKIEQLIEEKKSWMRRFGDKQLKIIEGGGFSHYAEEVQATKKEFDDLRNFASRLTREVYKNKPEKKVDEEVVQRELDNTLTTWQKGGEDDSGRKENFERMKGIKDNLGRGNFLPALEQIELNIYAIPIILEDLKDRDKLIREATEDFLKSMYGEDFRYNINQKLEDLRRMREFLKNKIQNAEGLPLKKEAGAAKEVLEDLKRQFGFVIHNMTVDGLLGGYTKFPYDKLSVEDQRKSLEDLKKVFSEYSGDRRVRGEKLGEFQKKIEIVRSAYFKD